MRISTKLYAGFAGVVAITICLAFYVSYISSDSLEKTIGKNSASLAQEAMRRIDHSIYAKMSEVWALAGRNRVIASLEASNARFAQMVNAKDFLDQTESQWRVPSNGNLSPVMKEVMENSLALELRQEFISHDEEKNGVALITGIFITNRYGALIASSGLTRDYRHDNEDWWNEAYARGISLGDISFVPCLECYGIAVAIRIDDQQGEFVGVVKAVFDAKAFIRRAELSIQEYTSSRVKLLTRDGRLIYSSRPYHFLEDLSGDPRLSSLKGNKGTYVDSDTGERQWLYSYAKSQGDKHYKGFGWILIIENDLAEILAPAKVLQKRIWFAGLALIFVSLMLSFRISRSIVTSLQRLNKGVKRIGDGDLSFRIETGANDEHCQLALTINDMAANLKQITSSRDDLNREIEARQKAEKEIRTLNRELEQRVAQRTKSLAEANGELEAFAYSVSHDLRGPLRAISGFSQMLLEDYGDALPKDGRRQLNVVTNSAEEMGRLIDGLLSFSRLGRAAMTFRSIDAERLVAEVFEELQQRREIADARLIVKALPTLRGDETMLKIVFTNLIGNALKYVRKDQSPVVDVSAEEKEGESVFSIKDNGVGFDMQYVDKLFNVFSRLHSDKEFEGTGIGLALVQRIISRHGGRVWAEAELDKGATFYFSLPKNEANKNDVRR